MTDIYELLNLFNELVLDIQNYNKSSFENLINIKAKIIFKDYSYLWVREIWKSNKLIAYSYYWFSNNDKIIIAWDNAPHHKEVETFPHHKHINDKVFESSEKNLLDVLNFIRDF